jgi:hypothetical protein
VGRITLAFQRWGSQEDWVSKVLLRHALASIIQVKPKQHEAPNFSWWCCHTAQ